MANVFSDIMADLLTDVPNQLSDAGVNHGRLRVKRAKLSITAAMNDGDIAFLARFKATDRIFMMTVVHDAITAGANYDFGVYQALGSSGAAPVVVDADILADSLDPATAARDELGDAGAFALGSGAGAFAPTKWGAELWDMAGVSARPATGTEYDVAILLTTAGTAAGEMVVTFFYTSGD